MRFLILAVILFNNITAFAAEAESNNVLNLQLSAGGSSNNLEFKNTAISNSPLLSYSTNSPGKMGLSLGYRNLGLGLSTSQPPTETNLKGNSEFQDYSLRFLGKNTFSFSYQKSKGFFVKDSQQAGTGVYLQKPDLRLEKFSAQWIYNFFNKDLSLPAAFNYSGHQNESAWTFLTFVQLNKSVIDDPVSLITTGQQANFSQFSNLKKIDRTSASGGVGFAAASVYNSFQLAALITLGGSIEEKIFTSVNNEQSHDSSGSSAVNLFLNAGYNGKTHQVGLTLVTSGYTTNLGTESLGESSQEIRFFYGYRFDGVNLGRPINAVSSWFD